MTKDPFMTELFNQALKKLDIPYKLAERSKSNRMTGTHEEVRLNDMHGNAISVLDVGYGVSQVLPIVFKCFSSRRKVLLIEQPELHLHPKLQANLADLFRSLCIF